MHLCALWIVSRAMLINWIITAVRSTLSREPSAIQWESKRIAKQQRFYFHFESTFSWFFRLFLALRRQNVQNSCVNNSKNALHISKGEQRRTKIEKINTKIVFKCVYKWSAVVCTCEMWMNQKQRNSLRGGKRKKIK